jgi:hypothetical protein
MNCVLAQNKKQSHIGKVFILKGQNCPDLGKRLQFYQRHDLPVGVKRFM